MKREDIAKKEPRRDRLIRERVHDPYKTRLKLAEPTVCPQCNAVYHEGRWQWAKLQPTDAQEEMCQACHRINDKYPAGEVTLGGKFFENHKEEILGLVRNVEKVENEEHPLHRIMTIVETEDGIQITTTDIHLPRRIGQALFDAWEGDFDFHYDEEGYFIRVTWSRTD